MQHPNTATQQALYPPVGLHFNGQQWFGTLPDRTFFASFQQTTGAWEFHFGFRNIGEALAYGSEHRKRNPSWPSISNFETEKAAMQYYERLAARGKPV